MCKKLTTNGVTRNSAIPLCQIPDYGIKTNKRNQKTWDEEKYIIAHKKFKKLFRIVI